MFQLQDIKPKALHATTPIFLGILVDTDNFELRLPSDKLSRLQEAIQQWMHRHSCIKWDLESLLGHLSHAATVVLQGRVFLQQLFSLLSLDRESYYFLRLNAGAKADLRWWHTFLQDWNGHFVLPSHDYVRTGIL